MAWRIDEAVMRGQIDNRTRGRVTGNIWFTDCAQPVNLDLHGNCWRDLAGRCLEFTNPAPKAVDLGGFRTLQDGVVGDITASRRVRVPDIPMDQVRECCLKNKPFPWHWGNSLYLEWFGWRNGRVVIESTSFELRVVGAAAWELSPEEEASQQQANEAAMQQFMDRVTRAIQNEGGAKSREEGA